jgi:hypothetical protein
MTGTDLYLISVYSVPVIFELPCIFREYFFIIIPTYAQTSSVKLILKLLRHVSVFIHHLQGGYKLC